MWELRASTSLARLWFDQRRHGEAHALLAQFRDCYTAGSDTPDILTTAQLRRLVEAAGRTPLERDTMYNLVEA